MLSHFAGLRVGEIASLKINDIAAEDGKDVEKATAKAAAAAEPVEDS